MKYFCQMGLVLACVWGLRGTAAAAEPAKADPLQPERGATTQTYKDKNGVEHRYGLFIPFDYDGTKEYPLILFLHGAGEREGGKRRPVEVGIGPAIKNYPQSEFPFFVLIPQCRANRNWMADGADAQRALEFLADVQKRFKIDTKRIYLTGLSMGGFGTWSLAIKYPDKWAAIVPICGGGDPTQADKIKHIPTWCFHGDKDAAVRVELSRQMIEALKKAGGNPRYTEYAGVGHNSWDAAYRTKELYAWLLAQRLK